MLIAVIIGAMIGTGLVVVVTYFVLKADLDGRYD